MRSAGRTTEELQIRADFCFALADRIYGRDIAALPYGPGSIGFMGVRGCLARIAYDRGCEWQERIAARSFRLTSELKP